MYQVFNVVPIGFFNNLASGSNQRIYADCIQLIYKEYEREGTGIDFSPLFMNVAELVKYSQYCKELSQNDEVKARNLISKGRYTETLQYMLDNDCKLEQEIISVSYGRS